MEKLHFTADGLGNKNKQSRMKEFYFFFDHRPNFACVSVMI